MSNEVFFIGGSPTNGIYFPNKQAGLNVLAALNQAAQPAGVVYTLATPAQITDVFNAQGNWCAYGYVNDPTVVAQYPITSPLNAKLPGCGGTYGVMGSDLASQVAGINVYGVKPGPGNSIGNIVVQPNGNLSVDGGKTFPYVILPFNTITHQYYANLASNCSQSACKNSKSDDKVAIGLGFALGFVVITFIVYFIVSRRRLNRMQ